MATTNIENALSARTQSIEHYGVQEVTPKPVYLGANMLQDVKNWSPFWHGVDSTQIGYSQVPCSLATATNNGSRSM